jgi:hypothetical protein
MATTPSNKTTAAKRPAAKRPAAKKRKTTAAPKPVAPQSAPERAVSYAQRAAHVQVGAVLTARDELLELVDELVGRVSTRDAAEKELKRFEKRGAGAQTRARRTVKKSRTRVERELRQRRNRVEREVKKNRTRVEREVRSLRKDWEGQVKSLRDGVQEFDLQSGVVTPVRDAVEPVVERVRSLAA